jgi:adenylosuccinate lyase
MLKNAWSEVILIALKVLNDQILENAMAYKKTPMLGRTHGQAAVPTTLGKEFLVFNERLQTEIAILNDFQFKAKLNGAVGNYNALYFVYPKKNWTKFSKDFINSFGFRLAKTTTQIAPYEDINFFFQGVQRINGILLDFNQDMWRYVSDGWFNQIVTQREVGSSTMPQKVNPILFENSEGNLIVANSLIEGFSNKLPISRLQRDLSGSTISRNFGVTLAYCLLAYKNSLSGLLRIRPNKEKLLSDLNSDWSILTEAVQIYLKKHGVKNGYELIKEKTRGEKMTKETFIEMVESLPLNQKQKGELKSLSPQTYIGLV